MANTVFLSFALLSGHDQNKANAQTRGPAIASDTRSVALATGAPLPEGEAEREAVGELLEEDELGLFVLKTPPATEAGATLLFVRPAAFL